MTSAPRKSRGKSDSSFWTREKTLQLIALYEKYSDLWNATSQLYGNRSHKQKLQGKIASKIECDVTEVSAKLHNLRCQYNGELRKMKLRKSVSGTDGSFVPRWEFFNVLKFLSNGGQSCSTASNLEAEEEISSQDGFYGSESNSKVVGPSSPASSERVVPLRGSHRKKKAVSKSTLQKEILMSKAMQILGTPADSQQIFGDYIADQLRNMTEPKQKRLKLLIQKAVIAVEEEPEPILSPATISRVSSGSTEQTSSP